MERPFPFRRGRGCQSAALGILGVVTLACAISTQAQTITRPDSAGSSPGETQAARNTPKKKFPTGGVWHHFGERQNASGTGRGQSGVRRSSESGANPRIPRLNSDATSPRQSLVTNRMAGLERQMWALVNQDRSKPDAFAETSGRAQPLKWNERLAAVARAHSRNMLEQRYFSHVDPDGKTFSMRINETGIPWQASGENIAIYDTVQAAEAAFMKEPRFEHNHRANILDASYTDVGIGVVQGPGGSLYITQDFVAVPPQSGAARGDP